MTKETALATSEGDVLKPYDKADKDDPVPFCLSNAMGYTEIQK
jgi:hypothetical protein